MQLQSDIDRITEWAQQWIEKLHPLKSESLFITRELYKPTHPDLFMSNTKIPVVQNYKHLGIFISDDCTWDCHIKSSTDKAWKRLNMMRTLKTRLDRKTLQIIISPSSGN